MKFRFFSRKTGWVGSDKIAKYFYSSVFEDNLGIAKEFVDLSGAEIITKINRLKLKKLYFFDSEKKKIILQLAELSEDYYNWFFYPIDTRITDARIYI